MANRLRKLQVLLDELDKLAADRNKTVAQIVVNWTMNQTGITATLCGAKRDWQIEETAAAMGWQLDKDDIARIGHCLNQLSD